MIQVPSIKNICKLFYCQFELRDHLNKQKQARFLFEQILPDFIQLGFLFKLQFYALEKTPAMPISKARKIHLYLSTLFVYLNFYSVLGILSRLKKPMAEEFDLTESFMGLLDGMTFIGGIIGNIYLVLVSVDKPVKGIIINGIVSIMALQSQCLSHVFPVLVQPIFVMSKLIYGICMIQLVLIISVLTHHFHSESDQPFVQIWISITALGDPIGIYLNQYFITSLGLSWGLAMTYSLILYEISLLYFFIAVKQISRQSENDNRQSTQGALQFLSRYFKQTINIIQSAYLALLFNLYYLLMLWTPYYFLKIDYGKDASIIAMAYAFMYIFGGLFHQFLRKVVSEDPRIYFSITMILNLVVSSTICFLNDDHSNFFPYLILLCCSSVCTSAHSCFAGTTDMKIRTQNDQEFTIVNSFNRIIWSVSEFGMMVLSGFWMEKDLTGFFKLHAILVFICCLLFLFRVKKYPKSLEYIDHQNRPTNNFSGIENNLEEE